MQVAEAKRPAVVTSAEKLGAKSLQYASDNSDILWCPLAKDGDNALASVVLGELYATPVGRETIPRISTVAADGAGAITVSSASDGEHLESKFTAS